MRCPVLAPLLALPALAGCGVPASGGKAAERPPLRPGVYEVTIDVVETTPPVPEERLGPILAAIGAGETRRQCLQLVEHRAGEALNEQCRYARVDDRAGRVSREAICAGGITIAFSGTRGGDAYDYRIVTRLPPAQGRAGVEVVVRERGRRVGDCPPES
jgi:hypothetical protein